MLNTHRCDPKIVNSRRAEIRRCMKQKGANVAVDARGPHVRNQRLPSLDELFHDFNTPAGLSAARAPWKSSPTTGKGITTVLADST